MSSEPLCDPHGFVNMVSALSGGASFAAWLVAQLPQLVETYQQKSVEGLSPIFVLIWVVGDLSSLIGCVLTQQLFFQYVLAIYFLFNDLVLCGQYYYYGIYLKKHHKHHHHHHHHHHRQSIQSSRHNSHGSIIVPALAIASNVGGASALPILEKLNLNYIISNNYTSASSSASTAVDSKFYGVFFAWLGAACYFFSRIPQLYKNYQRKSTQDLSPFLFACTLFGNLTYTLSILVSCEFIYDHANRYAFFMNEFPYIIGSAGTIIFDIFYFYQVWLYRDITLEENEPLLRRD